AAEGAGQERADGARAASRVSLARTETLTPFLDGADPSIAPPAPDALEGKLLEAEGAGRLRWRPGPRAPLVRLLPPPADAAERMQTLLRRAGRDDELELRRVVEYVEGQGCRLRALAAHFGVPLFAGCGRCDVCLGGATALGVDGAEARLQADPAALADPAAVIHACLAILPFGVGKKGLIRVLIGSVA